MTYPHLGEFASMLEALFVGPCQPLQRPMRLTEPGWDLSELRAAIQRLKTGKCGDEVGLKAELLKNVPDQLPTFVYGTKHLHIFCLDDSNIFWKEDSRKSSMGFGQDDDWKNTLSQLTYC